MSNLLKSEKRVLIVNDFTILKVVFVDNEKKPIEREDYHSNDDVDNLLNLLSMCWKNGYLPNIGDTIDDKKGLFSVVNKYFESEKDVLTIVFDLQ